MKIKSGFELLRFRAVSFVRGEGVLLLRKREIKLKFKVIKFLISSS